MNIKASQSSFHPLPRIRTVTTKLLLLTLFILSATLVGCGGSSDGDDLIGGIGSDNNDNNGNNSVPIALAGDNIVAIAGQTVELDGTGSTDSDGVITSYLWEETSGLGITINNSTDALASFVAPSANSEIIIRLTVTDEQGTQATDQILIGVSLSSTPVDAALCTSQGAECGVINDGIGGVKQCGMCSTGESCTSNKCDALVDDADIARQCAMQSAHCGVILDKLGRSINCGDPLPGEFCVDHRSEPLCELESLDDGKLDNLFAYVPLQYADEDLSPNQFSVNTTKMPIPVREPFNFVSRTDLEGKSIELDFGQESLSPAMTVSFKFIPADNSQKKVIFNSDALQIEQQNATITARLDTTNGPLEIDNSEASLKNHSCNHFAVVIDNNQISTWLNGKSTSLPADASTMQALEGPLAVGPYPGRVWDIRLFDQALSQEEVAELGEDCADTYVMESPYANSPIYMCGTYRCFWWEEGVTDTTQDSFEYQVEMHNMAYEHNIIASLVYEEGQFCEGKNAKKHMELPRWYRDRWVNKNDFSKPVGNYWLHENYHAYQSNANNRTGKWYTEASANWAAYSMKPGTDENHLVGFYTLQPHQPLYAREIVPEEWTAFSQYSGGHMYGAGLFVYYLGVNYLGIKVSGEVYRYVLASKASTPVEALYLLVENGGFDMRDVFGEFAVKTITWDYPYGEGFKLAEDSSRQRMDGRRKSSDNPWPEEDVDNKITAVYAQDGTGGNFVSVPDRYLPGSWAYNAYQVKVENDTTYRIELVTSQDNVEFAEFRATVVVHNESSGERTYHELVVAGPGETSSINVAAKGGEKVYLVVATTPSQDFSSYTMYRYDYSIEEI